MSQATGSSSSHHSSGPYFSEESSDAALPISFFIFAKGRGGRCDYWPTCTVLPGTHGGGPTTLLRSPPLLQARARRGEKWGQKTDYPPKCPVSQLRLETGWLGLQFLSSD